MFGKGWDSTVGIEARADDLHALRRFIVEETAKRLFEIAVPVAEENGYDDFPEIMNHDEDDGSTPMEAVVDELAAIAEQHPRIVEAMRPSEDWDEEAHADDVFRAAAAAVSEALEAAAGLWNDRVSSPEV